MREHLYQGKRKDNGEWVQGDLIHRQIWASSLCIIRVSDDGFDNYEEYEVDPETVSEFTGLRDKNGKRIFEGDIINYEDGDPSDYEYHDGTIMNVGEIIFCDGKFCFTNAVSVTMDDLLCENNMLDCEVIGNKWDNPELLEG